MRMRVPLSVSTTAPTLVRRSLGSGDLHTAHPQPSWGTPKEVPVPRKVSFIGNWDLGAGNRELATSGSQFPVPSSRLDSLDFDHIGRTRHIERHTGRDHHRVPRFRHLAFPNT